MDCSLVQSVQDMVILDATVQVLSQPAPTRPPAFGFLELLGKPVAALPSGQERAQARQISKQFPDERSGAASFR